MDLDLSEDDPVNIRKRRWEQEIGQMPGARWMMANPSYLNRNLNPSLMGAESSSSSSVWATFPQMGTAMGSATNTGLHFMNFPTSMDATQQLGFNEGSSYMGRLAARTIWESQQHLRGGGGEEDHTNERQG